MVLTAFVVVLLLRSVFVLVITAWPGIALSLMVSEREMSATSWIAFFLNWILGSPLFMWPSVEGSILKIVAIIHERKNPGRLKNAMRVVARILIPQWIYEVRNMVYAKASPEIDRR